MRLKFKVLALFILGAQTCLAQSIFRPSAVGFQLSTQYFYELSEYDLFSPNNTRSVHSSVSYERKISRAYSIGVDLGVGSIHHYEISADRYRSMDEVAGSVVLRVHPFAKKAAHYFSSPIQFGLVTGYGAQYIFSQRQQQFEHNSPAIPDLTSYLVNGVFGDVKLNSWSRIRLESRFKLNLGQEFQNHINYSLGLSISPERLFSRSHVELIQVDPGLSDSLKKALQEYEEIYKMVDPDQTAEYHGSAERAESARVLKSEEIWAKGQLKQVLNGDYLLRDSLPALNYTICLKEFPLEHLASTIETLKEAPSGTYHIQIHPLNKKARLIRSQDETLINPQIYKLFPHLYIIK